MRVLHPGSRPDRIPHAVVARNADRPDQRRVGMTRSLRQARPLPAALRWSSNPSAGIRQAGNG